VERGIGEAYQDISTFVLNILQAEIGTTSATEESENIMLSHVSKVQKVKGHMF
jgi:hypothetical protein